MVMGLRGGGGDGRLLVWGSGVGRGGGEGGHCLVSIPARGKTCQPHKDTLTTAVNVTVRSSKGLAVCLCLPALGRAALDEAGMEGDRRKACAAAKIKTKSTPARRPACIPIIIAMTRW